MTQNVIYISLICMYIILFSNCLHFHLFQASKILKSLSSSFLSMFGPRNEASEDNSPLKTPNPNLQSQNSNEESKFSKPEPIFFGKESQDKPRLEKRLLRTGSPKQLSEETEPNLGRSETRIQKPKSRRPPSQDRVSLGNQKNRKGKDPVQPLFIGYTTTNPSLVIA